MDKVVLLLCWLITIFKIHGTSVALPWQLHGNLATQSGLAVGYGSTLSCSVILHYVMSGHCFALTLSLVPYPNNLIMLRAAPSTPVLRVIVAGERVTWHRVTL